MFVLIIKLEMSFTVMKSVPIFYLHCTCYKFRIAVLIFDRINVIRVKSLEDISRRSVHYLTKTISTYSARFVFPNIALYFSLIGGTFPLLRTNT